MWRDVVGLLKHVSCKQHDMRPTVGVKCYTVTSAVMVGWFQFHFHVKTVVFRSVFARYYYDTFSII